MQTKVTKHFESASATLFARRALGVQRPIDLDPMLEQLEQDYSLATEEVANAFVLLAVKSSNPMAKELAAKGLAQVINANPKIANSTMMMFLANAAENRDTRLSAMMAFEAIDSEKPRLYRQILPMLTFDQRENLSIG